MAGLKAAISAPTWPDINGSMIPASMNELYPWSKNLVNNNITVHFIHRGLAYLLLILVIIWWLKAKAVKENPLFSRLRSSILLLTLLQVVLGIFTVLNATYTNRLVVLGVLHQCTAMLLLMSAVTIVYILRKNTVV
jgi:cytochrome c oxidase assembly protein subunit 15